MAGPADQMAQTARAYEGGKRIPTLDGYRGLASMMVVVSHYFGEVPHGMHALMFGWVGVDIFFVLSGFLIGGELLDRRHLANVFAVFYARRFFRIFPVYVVTLLVVSGLIQSLPRAWTNATTQFPLWSYLATLQGLFMVATQSIGAFWLLPTWTLAVEVHFYLIAPVAIIFAPRRWLTPALIGIGLAVIAFRAAIYFGGMGNGMMALALLPGRADLFIWGILAAIAIRNREMPWSRLLLALRITPVAMLVSTCLLRLIGEPSFLAFGPTLVGLGCAAFLLCLVLGAPEAKRFLSRSLRFCGDNAYCIYLTHLPILGVMHGLILGTTPDLATPAQWLVTFAAVPVCIIVGWAMTRLIEAPSIRFGRNWQWTPASRAVARSQVPAPSSDCQDGCPPD
jgi:peptidoglycan/LPS O-acetylase OafA/YrhL